MIPFDFNRFGKLARWSLVNDRSYYVRTFLQMVTVLTLVFLFFTLEGNGTTIHDEKGYTVDHYMPCLFVSLYVLIITLVIGPSLMFYSMKGKHDRQTLLMLPASNLEKYLMRYSTWILLVPILFLAFFAADLIQYVVNWLVGRDYTTFVTTHFLYDEHMVNWRARICEEISRDGEFVPYAIGLWFHSVYALGATFFRSHKFNAVFTTIALVMFLTSLVWLINSCLESNSDVNQNYNGIVYTVCIGLTVLDFWLSYRLFCRTQVIGKIVNV